METRKQSAHLTRLALCRVRLTFPYALGLSLETGCGRQQGSAWLITAWERLTFVHSS